MAATLKPPGEVVEIARRLEDAGFETWCVGGAVRDALLGHPHLDWDLATAATPGQVRRLFERTVPIGIEFGTVGVLDRRGIMHEVTTFRRDVRTDGRHAEVEFGVSLDDDLARRDFTINAIAYSTSRKEVHDPFGGRADLDRGVVRAVGDPATRMAEDRLRALRAIRFAARFGFEIESDTWKAIVQSTPYLDRLSAERIQQELEKTMDQVERPSAAISRWIESGAMGKLIPELKSLSPVALTTLDCLPRPGLIGRPQRRINRLTALMLDLEPGAVAGTLSRLRFSRSDADWTSKQVARWREVGMEVGAALREQAAITDGRARRWAARLGRTTAAPLLRVAAARWAALSAAGHPAPDQAVVRSLYRRIVRSAYRDAIELSELAVDGDDLRRVGIPTGPDLGRILHALLEIVIDDPSQNTYDALCGQALRLWRDRQSG